MTVHITPLAQDIAAFLEYLATPALAARDTTGQLKVALSRVPPLLTRAFNTAAAPARQSRPALEFEAAQNLRGIGHHYTFPAGVDAPVLESYVMALSWSAYHRVTPQLPTLGALHKVIDTLVALNPVLDVLRYDRHNFMQAYHLAMGITSGFNPRDIQFFVDGNTGQVAKKDPAYRQRLLRAEETLPARSLNWIPAPDTLDRIIKQKTAAAIGNRIRSFD